MRGPEPVIANTVSLKECGTFSLYNTLKPEARNLTPETSFSGGGGRMLRGAQGGLVEGFQGLG